MAEWSIAAVLKTVELKGSRGSNPCLSASPLVSAGFFLPFLEGNMCCMNVKSRYICHEFSHGAAAPEEHKEPEC
jgi:hypothetical protein